MSHGGSRKGAGRPKGQGPYKESTKPVRLPISLISSVLKFVENKGYKIPFYHNKVSAGSPAAADDLIEDKFSLNDLIIKNPQATFFVRATGLSMIAAGIHENDILVVDKSITPTNGKIVIASIDGQLTVKRLNKIKDVLWLMAENKNFNHIEVKSGSEIFIWGVVTNVIHAV